jgi:hypothetical protein
MTKETFNTLVSGVYDLGLKIEEYVKDGWTLAEGSPSEHGWMIELRMERGEQPAQETKAVFNDTNKQPEQSEDKPAPKPKGRPAKAAEDK